MMEIVHQLPGRARFKIAELRGSETMASYIERHLEERKGIIRASASRTTGSVLVLFASGRTLDSVGRKLSEIVEDFARDPDASRPELEKGFPLSSHERLAPPWHVIDGCKAAEHFNTDLARGLTAREAEARLAAYGPNSIPGSEPRGFGVVAKRHLLSFPVVLTGATAVFSVLTGRIVEGVIALSAAMVNAGAGSIFESRAERSLREARKSVDLRARVLRDGQTKDIPFECVVPGDVLVLSAGSRIPADARIVESLYLSVDESAFTGESLPIEKSAVIMTRETVPVSRRRNMLFRGTLVVGGTGKAVVVATGNHTMLGRLLVGLGVVFPPEAFVAREIRNFVRRSAAVGAVGFGLFGILSLIRGRGIADLFRGGLVLAAGVFPSEIATIAMSAFALRQGAVRKSGVLVRRLRALGNIASIQMVCFDKTGTLTLNKMVVSEIRAGGAEIKFDREGLPRPGMSERLNDQEVVWLIKLAALCNETLEDYTGGKSKEVSSTEMALLQLAESVDIDLTVLDEEYPVEEIRRREDGKPYMSTLHRTAEGGTLLALKGSPMEVLEKCSRYAKNLEAEWLEENDRLRIENDNFAMAGDGLRVLGVAYRFEENGSDLSDPDGYRDFVWAGLVGFSDPVRKGAKSLIRNLHEAGIRTSVITGDQSLTAQYIGEHLGLSGDEPLRILDTKDLKRFDAVGLRHVATRAHVFANLSPEQKLLIIQAFQSAGMGVAMVGDGFNDVLALKSSDVGIAMGREGVDQARDAADLVLEDDRLESVFDAVVQGRAFYDNIRKSLSFLTGVNHVHVLSEVAAQSGLARHGMSPWQGIWTNLACLALAAGPPSGEVFRRPPNDPKDPMLAEEDVTNSRKSAFLQVSTAGVAGVYGLARYGSGGTEAGRLFWKSVCINQMLYAASLRQGNGNRTAGKSLGLPLAATLTVAVGSHLLGVVLPKPVAGLLDAAALATAGLIFRKGAMA